MGLYYPASKQHQPKRKNTKTRPEYKLVEDRGAPAKTRAIVLRYRECMVGRVVSRPREEGAYAFRRGP